MRRWEAGTPSGAVGGLVWRQWWKNAAMAASSSADSPLFLFDYLLRALRVLVLLSIWRMILGEPGVRSPLPLETVLTYVLIAEVFAEQLSVRTELQNAFWQGTIAMHFLRPMGIVAQFASHTLGRWALDFALFSLPLLALSGWLGVSPLPAGGAAAGLFALSLGLAIAVGLALEFLFAALTVALEQPVWLIDFVRRALTGLLAGFVIPLSLMPWGLGAILELLPFATLVWAPLAIYTGAGDAARLLALQGFWCVVLWPTALWVWNASREKVVGYGG